MKSGTVRTVSVSDKIAAEIFGEPMYSLAEANALGYCTVNQWAEKMKVTRDVASRKISVAVVAGKMESVKLSVSGGPRAYRIKAP